MAQIPSKPVIPNQMVLPLVMSGQPSNGASAIWILNFGGTPTGGTFTITLDGYTTAAITWSSTNATLVSNIDTALEALPNVGTGGVTTAALNMTSGIGTISVTAAGNIAAKTITTPTVTSSLTGTSPTLTVVEALAGSDASFRGCGAGTIVLDSATGNYYRNTSTTLAPNWVSHGVIYNSGAPSAGTSSVNTLTVQSGTSGGSSTLTFNGKTTAAITWSATNATLLANINNALADQHGSGVFTAAAGTLTSGIGTITITAGGRLSAQVIGAMTITNGFTGGSAATVSETTAGVAADYRGVGVGALVMNTSNGKLYTNTGTVDAPTWTIVGTQS